MNPKRKRSKVFAFGTGQLAVQKSTGLKVRVLGARRTRNGLLIVATVTSTTRNKGALIVAKATSFAPRPSKTAVTPLVVGV